MASTAQLTGLIQTMECLIAEAREAIRQQNRAKTILDGVRDMKALIERRLLVPLAVMLSPNAMAALRREGIENIEGLPLVQNPAGSNLPHYSIVIHQNRDWM